MEYTPKNNSDIVKHSNLNCLAKNIDFKVYVEFHSGEGIYGDYYGSPAQMIKYASIKEKDKFEFYLHEIKEERRKKLLENLNKIKTGNINLNISGKWQKNIEYYLGNANKNWIILIDPSYSRDYHCKNGINAHLRSLIKTNANIFMYFPETLSIKSNRESIGEIYSLINSSGKNGIDFQLPVVNQGYFKRSDHNIIITDENALEKLKENHLKICLSLFKEQEILSNLI